MSARDLVRGRASKPGVWTLVAGVGLLAFLTFCVLECTKTTHVGDPKWGWCCDRPRDWCREAQVCTATQEGAHERLCVRWETQRVCDRLCDRWAERAGADGEDCR